MTNAGNLQCRKSFAQCIPKTLLLQQTSLTWESSHDFLQLLYYTLYILKSVAVADDHIIR